MKIDDVEIDLNRPVYQLTGELNARVAQLEELAGIDPIWYVDPQQTLADFHEQARQRMERLEIAAAQLEKDVEDAENRVEKLEEEDRQRKAAASNVAEMVAAQKDSPNRRGTVSTNAAEAIDKIDQILAISKKENGNDTEYVASLISLRQALKPLTEVDTTNQDWSSRLGEAASAAKRVIAKTDEIVINAKGSPTILFALLLLICLIMGWNPLVALASTLGLPTSDPEKAST